MQIPHTGKELRVWGDFSVLKFVRRRFGQSGVGQREANYALATRPLLMQLVQTRIRLAAPLINA